VSTSCDVCRLVRGDTSAKLVEFCKLCNAWLCDRCRQQPLERIKAALLKWRGY
jgi:hypothetical protein